MEIGNFKKSLCKLILPLVLTFQALAKHETIAIVVPSALPPISGIFDQIIEGITKSTPKYNKKKLILNEYSRDSLNNWLAINNPIAIIAIGNKAILFARSVSINTLVITSGSLLVSDADKDAGVSLSLAEDTLKKKLSLYLPHIKKLHIGDQGENLIWFSNNIRSPQIERKIIGHNQKSIIKYLWTTINNVDPKTEAVWINNKIEHYFLYKLSERAWERKVTLISNNIEHLESGTLMAFYPDFELMGERLGVITSMAESGLPPLEPLKAITQGINMRTAKHLDIHISPSIEKDFGVIIK